jgi:hypothetical protein
MVQEMAAFRHAHQAVMLSMTAATRRYVRLTLGAQREKWRDKREAKEGQ